ncbi:MAG: hypothetical protein N2049_03075 [Anaerolineales bacterium]|nr:hypothetical protein [Anaerolineales bacterium]MCX7608186.1 hypothetical protein [Anaerolineales bacterium]MDW8226355.1 hypothetical protein [Anaerolineales bacterium]
MDYEEKRAIFIIVIGFILVTLGMVLPFLMVMQIVRTTFFLSFLSYSATVVGLFLGFIGSATYVRLHQKKDDR